MRCVHAGIEALDGRSDALESERRRLESRGRRRHRIHHPSEPRTICHTTLQCASHRRDLFVLLPRTPLRFHLHVPQLS
jgi:hypothetical protein